MKKSFGLLVVRNNARRHYLLVIIPLVLSAFTHLWNPIGFPHVDQDEGHYMRRAMQVLQGFGPQESMDTYYFPYDHPYFGQLFLAGVFKIIGYPDILDPKVGDVHSIEMLYLVPRVLMGLLAVLDTFLIYKIAERKYNRTVAFIAAVLFAVMPFSWIFRRILLDSIQLPFILSSILCALYIGSLTKTNTSDKNKKIICLGSALALCFSGIFLGLAIFTKLLAFTMIPLVGYLVIYNNRTKEKRRSFKILWFWFIPVILLPLIWPLYPLLNGNFDEWIEGILWQTSRTTRSLSNTLEHIIVNIDPLLILITVSGFIYAQIRRDYFLLLWAIPYLVTLFLVDWVYFFHLTPIFPAFCISAAVLFSTILRKYYNRIQEYMAISLITSIIVMSLFFTITLISSNVNSPYFQLVSFLNEVIPGNEDETNASEKVAVVGPNGSWSFIWLVKYIFERDIDFRWFDHGSDYLGEPVSTQKFLLVVDREMRYSIFLSNSNEEHVRQIRMLYDNSTPLKIFNSSMYGDNPRKYPYTNIFDDFYKVGNITKMRGVDWSREIEVRGNYSIS